MSGAPVGDPDGMRALATQWMRAAGELDGIAGELTIAAAIDGFEGPAATLVAERAGAVGQGGRSIAGALESLAAELLADARALEELQQEAAHEAALRADAETGTVPAAAAGAPDPPAASTPEVEAGATGGAPG
jgi:hypothetical protein